MPDFLPVCMQDFLHRRKPELREGEITLSYYARCKMAVNGENQREKRGQTRHVMYDGSACVYKSQENHRDTSVYQ